MQDGECVVGVIFFFPMLERNANYWASGSVKCTAVVTVSARWTIELVYNLTVGGVSRSHTNNHPVALHLLPTSISR